MKKYLILIFISLLVLSSYGVNLDLKLMSIVDNNIPSCNNIYYKNNEIDFYKTTFYILKIENKKFKYFFNSQDANKIYVLAQENDFDDTTFKYKEIDRKEYFLSQGKIVETVDFIPPNNPIYQTLYIENNNDILKNLLSAVDTNLDGDIQKVQDKLNKEYPNYKFYFTSNDTMNEASTDTIFYQIKKHPDGRINYIKEEYYGIPLKITKEKFEENILSKLGDKEKKYVEALYVYVDDKKSYLLKSDINNKKKERLYNLLVGINFLQQRYFYFYYKGNKIYYIIYRNHSGDKEAIIQNCFVFNPHNYFSKNYYLNCNFTFKNSKDLESKVEDFISKSAIPSKIFYTENEFEKNILNKIEKSNEKQLMLDSYFFLGNYYGLRKGLNFDEENQIEFILKSVGFINDNNKNIWNNTNYFKYRTYYYSLTSKHKDYRDFQRFFYNKDDQILFSTGVLKDNKKSYSTDDDKFQPVLYNFSKESEGYLVRFNFNMADTTILNYNNRILINDFIVKDKDNTIDVISCNINCYFNLPSLENIKVFNSTILDKIDNTDDKAFVESCYSKDNINYYLKSDISNKNMNRLKDILIWFKKSNISQFKVYLLNKVSTTFGDKTKLFFNFSFISPSNLDKFVFKVLEDEYYRDLIANKYIPDDIKLNILVKYYSYDQQNDEFLFQNNLTNEDRFKIYDKLPFILENRIELRKFSIY